MAPPTQWMWVRVSSRSWWWTGKLGMLWSIRSQRVRHNWATELNWTTEGCNIFTESTLLKYYHTVSFLLVLEMNCLWVSWFANISLHSGLPSSFIKISFFGHLLWNWSRSHFPGFGLFLISLGDGFQKTLQWCHPNPKICCSFYHHVSFLCFP